jgi:Carbohydrate family 9 binding domain-like
MLHSRLVVFIALLCLCAFGGVTHAAAKFNLNSKGLGIDSGVAGDFDLKLPTLEGLKPTAPVDTTLSADGTTLDLTYAGGATGKIKLESDKSITITFSNIPEQVHNWKIETFIPIGFNGGGMYAIGGAQPQPFPQQKSAKPFLYQGNAQSISVIHPSKIGFTLSGFAQGTFQQLQDNREWNWGIFNWFALVPLPAGNDNPSFQLKLEDAGDAAPHALIDKYGQHITPDFPDKVKSDDDLKSDVQRDADYFAALNPPATDKYGGLPGSGEKYGLKKTGFFHVEKAGNAQVLVDPDGNAFFQLGMCEVIPCDDYTVVAGRESTYQWLPAANDSTFATAWRDNTPGVMSFYLANLVRKYDQPFDLKTYTQRWIDHLKKWGFNSGGAWAFSGDGAIAAATESNYPYVTFVGSGAAALGVKEVWDPFTDDIDQKMDQEMSRAVAPQADNPLLIGYFLTNEPLLEDVPKAVPGMKGSKIAAKRRLVQMLKEEYPSIDAFNTAWDTKATGFDELNDTPLIVATKTASDDMQKYFELFLETRYSLIAKYFHKYDHNHLLIGDRWMPGTANSETLVRIASKYLDVISVNYYTYGIDKNFLDRIHKWSGDKPMLLSEFYFAARDQGMGGGTQVSSQSERGLAYRNYVEQAASTGYVVGIQWFLAHDQATTGRFFEGFNGESANTGLVNVADRPYKDFLAEVVKTNYDIYSVAFGQRQPFVYDDPRFTMKQGGTKLVQVPRMTKPVVLDGQRTEWPGVPPTRIGAEGLVQGRDAKDFEASYWLAYDDQNLYVFAEVIDSTPMQNDLKDESMWANDCLELFTGYDNLDQGGSLQFGDRQILIRGGKVNSSHSAMVFVNAPKSHYDGKSSVTPGPDGKSYTIEASIPWEALGFTPKGGQEILFDICVDDGGGGRRQLAWNGTARDSKDRGAWGHATFGN